MISNFVSDNRINAIVQDQEGPHLGEASGLFLANGLCLFVVTGGPCCYPCNDDQQDAASDYDFVLNNFANKC